MSFVNMAPELLGVRKILTQLAPNAEKNINNPLKPLAQY